MLEKNYNSVKPLKQLLDKLIKLHGWEDKLQFNRIIEFWSDIVGDSIAKHTEVKKITEGVLHIKTDSAALRSELIIRQEEIIKQINERLSAKTVISLKIR